MGMPWDTPRQQPPRYSPPPAQQMKPDLPPVVARNPQTGETVRVDLGADLREAIRQAVAASVVENKDAMLGNAQAAIKKVAQGQKPTVTAPQGPIELEGEFEMGPSTKRTLLQGLAVDLGFAATATLATVTSTDFNFFDKEAWTLTAVMMLKTLIQTGMSYMMRLKVE